MDLQTILGRLVRVGKVSSVDIKYWTCRVIFEDLLGADGQPMVSGDLPVLTNMPAVTLTGKEAGTSWNYEAQCATFSGRTDITPVPSYTSSWPDRVKITRTDDYTITSADGDTLDHQTWEHEMILRPWLPYIGQTVVCVYLPVRNADGFVIGGLYK